MKYESQNSCCRWDGDIVKGYFWDLKYIILKKTQLLEPTFLLI